MESYLSGYCRTIDASRMVLVEDGEADCDYERCDYRDVCPIGRQIADSGAWGGASMNICLYGASSRRSILFIWTPLMPSAACSRSMGTRSSTAAGRRA